MSRLLSEEAFTHARTSARVGEVTEDLYLWLGQVVALAQATRSLAPAAVPSGRWDDADAVAETLQAWLEESLLRGALLRAFDVCATPASLARYLERALRNWLTSRSRRRNGPRLAERADELMREDARFSLVHDATSREERWWALRAWKEPELMGADDNEVIALAWSLGDFALLRYPSSERSDPVLSTSDLERFLLGLLEAAAQALSGRHISVSLQARFAYAYATDTLPADELAELATTQALPESELLVEDAARVALADLDKRQLLVLFRRPTMTLETLATELGVSRGTVDNEYRRALGKVNAAAPSSELFDAVLEKVLEMASTGLK